MKYTRKMTMYHNRLQKRNNIYCLWLTYMFYNAFKIHFYFTTLYFTNFNFKPINLPVSRPNMFT